MCPPPTMLSFALICDDEDGGEDDLDDDVDDCADSDDIIPVFDIN